MTSSEDGLVHVGPGVAEGEDRGADGAVGHGMDLVRATGGGDSLGDPRSASQDAAAEHDRAGDALRT